MNSIPHSFSVEVAKKHGVEAAIFLAHLQFWIIRNKGNGKNLKEGRTWSYNSMPAYRQIFPYWSIRQLERIIGGLIESGIILSKQLSQNQHDRTNWYAFSDESEWIPPETRECIPPNGGMDTTKRWDASPPNGGISVQVLTSCNNQPTEEVILPPELEKPWEDWIRHLKEKRVKRTPMCMDRQKRKLLSMPIEDAIKTIDHAIESGWQGLHPKPTEPMTIGRNGTQLRKTFSDGTPVPIITEEGSGHRTAKDDPDSFV